MLRLSNKKYKAVTTQLVTKYRALLAGNLPPNLPSDKEKRAEAIACIASSMRRVTTALKSGMGGPIPESKNFNPFMLECKCKAGRLDVTCTCTYVSCVLHVLCVSRVSRVSRICHAAGTMGSAPMSSQRTHSRTL